jgi:CheY-like chemotaxis protein
VDDEQRTLDALRRALSTDHEVVALTAASRALERLEAGDRYDVVLCALMMPKMDGIELHRRLATSSPGEADRIVFFTGEALTARVDAFLRRVPNLLLVEPIDVEGLRALIERRVGARRSAEDAAGAQGRSR